MKKIFGVLLLLVVLLPVAFIVTVIINPFWRYFEEVTGIESFGHSGPAEWCYYLDYLLLVAGALLVKRLLKGKVVNDNEAGIEP